MFPFIRIGGFYLPTYGLLVASAFVLALWIVARLSRKSGVDPDAAINLGIYTALGGILGSKALMVAFDFGYYVEHPGELFSLTTLQAGGIFFGGLITGLATAVWYMRRKKLPGLRTADIFAPGLALGHGIGRLGCFSAGCCWGAHAHSGWTVTFTNTEANRLFGTPLNTPLYPTQLYEAFAEFAIFGILMWLFRKPHGPGGIIGAYLVMYPAARFTVEFFRAHDSANPYIGPLVTEQWIALALMAAGAWLIASSRRAAKPFAGEPQKTKR